MPRIKHIVGMKEIARVDSAGARGYYLSDGDLNLAKLAAAGSARRDDVNEALGVGHGRRDGGNVEVKYRGPDGVMIDASETGWVGTDSFRP